VIKEGLCNNDGRTVRPIRILARPSERIDDGSGLEGPTYLAHPALEIMAIYMVLDQRPRLTRPKGVSGLRHPEDLQADTE
jgi:hypothetical protein